MNYFYEKDFMNTKKKKNKKKKINKNFPLLISKYEFVSFFPCPVSVFIIFTERNYFYDNHYINTK